jgi:hypothetical protein
LEGARLGGVVQVGGLDRAAARSLCVHLTDFGPRTELDLERSLVEVATDGRPIAVLLHHLEEWTRASGLRSILINLDGREYILEAAPAKVAREEELLPSASPVA